MHVMYLYFCICVCMVYMPMQGLHMGEANLNVKNQFKQLFYKQYIQNVASDHRNITDSKM